ncbi:MAG: hypothetical protein A3E31_15890 [Candidatus Rokubacteria bacterium RIFCSPHIGHO2_12_FULL_73_22]|nr:MAG: hypothetical protein A3D33_14245 [Candidatus Rokubacteria bacterium RIFCSPHIGHO2_02_FULL_73_26]OGL04776.1 MAG: hypothetical protein A3E31_15890 [Candidatus Rokubacteria bacterium RIFCSPHIGHO2_12_FULL_73_22]OGL08608.1 MAG: hypothetical protein A3I14_17605 [Candidatus Rokubacteria bacterium RIFCSPLOWO2_02_FULL_73_56]
MSRLLAAALGVALGLSGLAATAAADHAKSTLQILAENPGARLDSRVQLGLLRERMASPPLPQLQVVTYPTALEVERELDQQIRRLGELIRRQPQD